MRKILLLFSFLYAFSANGQQPYSCKDSTLIDTYFQCGLYAGGDVFEPVCGCDNVTYRNQCAAEKWGGLYYNSWTSGVCGNFAFDFRPTALSYSSSVNSPARIQLYLNNPSGTNFPINVYIYDVYGKLWYTWNTATSINGLFPLSPKELPLQALDMGIYILIVTVNNEKQSLKFGKLTSND